MHAERPSELLSYSAHARRFHSAAFNAQRHAERAKRGREPAAVKESLRELGSELPMVEDCDMYKRDAARARMRPPGPQLGFFLLKDPLPLEEVASSFL